MAISPVSSNSPNAATPSTNALTAHPSNRNSIKSGRNNSSSNRANAVSEQQPRDQVNSSAVVQETQAQKVGLSPINLV